MQKIVGILKKYWIYITGMIIGAMGGYMYWYHIGCLTGTCPLKATPIVSILLGISVGLYVSTFFKRKNNIS